MKMRLPDRRLIGKGTECFSLTIEEMDDKPAADCVDKQCCKNKRKLAQPSVDPATFAPSLVEFPRYELPISQSLSDFNLKELGSDSYRELSEIVMREVADWNDPIASQLEDLLMTNLQAIFCGAISKIVELGYTEDIAEKVVSRKALYIKEGDPVSNIVLEALNILKGKDVVTEESDFENLQHLLHYTLVELISVLREVRPSLTVGDAMWVLLMCDLNISLACAAEEENRSDVVCNNEESSADSSIPQSKSEVQSADINSDCSSPSSPNFQKGSSPSHQNHMSEAPDFESFLNFHNNQSPHGSERVKIVEHASLTITADKSSGISVVSSTSTEYKPGSSSKRHTRKEMAALRQKFLHMEKTYRACGKGSFKSGKITSVGGLVVEKRLKSPSENPTQKMKCGSSNKVSTKGVRLPNGGCNVSITAASASSGGGSAVTIPTKDAISTSPAVNTNTSTPSTALKPKSTPNSSVIQKIIDYCAGIPFDETLGKYVPRDEKDGQVLKLISQVQALQDEVQSWNNWTYQKVMQVTYKLGKMKAEFISLRKEKQEAELFKKDTKLLEENAIKRISEMENAVENTKKQIESASSATLILETKKSLLLKELDAAQVWAEKAMGSHQQAMEREQMASKHAQSWESQKGLLRDELETEKHKLSNLQQELDKEKRRKANVEGRLEKERVVKEKILAQAASIRKEREKLEARTKSEEDVIRKKAASDLQEYVEGIAKLEKELVGLKTKSDSEKIAALRWCIDERNDSFSRTGKNTQTVKGDKKSETSMMGSCQDKSRVENLRREQECVMCLSEEMSVVFLPCAHQVVCPDCNELHEKQGMKDCPSCRTTIQRRIHARFAGC